MQGLIKYHGLKDEKLRLPYHDSISVATAPLLTRTTVEFGDFRSDSATVDGRNAEGRSFERILSVVDEVRRLAGIRSRFRMVSVSDFPSGVGLGASSSGFAALATAASSAAGLKLEKPALSALSRLGAGSATRAVTGGFSRWRMGTRHEDSFAYRLDSGDIDMQIVIALIENVKQTEDAHREVVRSPLFAGRLSYLHDALSQMEQAISARDISRIGSLAETDTLVLHAVTMSGPSGMIFWKPETLSLISEVRRMRKEGVDCHFSIDTGATAYVNCTSDAVHEVESRIGSLGIRTIRCTVGGPSRLTNEHLF
jgi:phosphomevalonate decarboxylase